MPWTVGFDEAGYGPNLGPLLQAAVAVQLPIEDLAGWEALRRVVRKSGGRWGRDLRLVIDDSKKVYHGVNALERLERGLFGAFGWQATTFGTLLQSTLPEWSYDELLAEAWFDPELQLPIASTPAMLKSDREHFLFSLPTGCQCLAPLAILTPTPWFNKVVEATGSKASLLSNGLMELLKSMVNSTPGIDPLILFCDKQGGRTYYAEFLRTAFPELEVCPELERAEESRYRLEGTARTITVVFRPRADGESIAVALASMVCKYIREVCMMQFNAYWAKHVPDIAPTAGYPLDAKRFYDQIKHKLGELDLSDDQVWRKK
jgi:hypothetical protein